MTPFLNLVLILITLYIIMVIGSKLIKTALLVLILTFTSIYLLGNQQIKQKFDNTVVEILTKVKSNKIVNSVNENAEELIDKAKDIINKTNN